MLLDLVMKSELMGLAALQPTSPVSTTLSLLTTTCQQMSADGLYHGRKREQELQVVSDGETERCMGSRHCAYFGVLECEPLLPQATATTVIFVFHRDILST